MAKTRNGKQQQNVPKNFTFSEEDVVFHGDLSELLKLFPRADITLYSHTHMLRKGRPDYITDLVVPHMVPVKTCRTNSGALTAIYYFITEDDLPKDDEEKEKKEEEEKEKKKESLTGVYKFCFA